MTQMLTEQAAKLREANRKLEAHHAVTQALAESGTLLETAPKILQALCITLNWDLGALWLFDEQASGMRCKVIWGRDGAPYGDFARASRECLLQSGSVVAGRVYSSGEPLWIGDVVTEPDFERARTAALRAVIAGWTCPLAWRGWTNGSRCGREVTLFLRSDT